MVRVLVCLVALFVATPSFARAMIETDHLRAELIPRNAATAPGEATDVAIRVRVADGWHTYWKNPGDVGEAPRATWTLPEGASADPLRFPAPERLPYPPFVNFGYKSAFTLMTRITVPADWRPGAPLRVPVQMDFLVCEEICIPESGVTLVEIATGATTTPDSQVAFTFVQAQWAMPEEAPAPLSYARDGDDLYLTVPFGQGAEAAFFPVTPGLIDNAAPQTATPAADGAGFTLKLMSGAGRLDGTMAGVLTTSEGAWQVAALGDPDPAPDPASDPVAAPPPAAPVAVSAPAPPPIGVAEAVLFAFLGGLILNLMPCVFPVLALKVFGLVRHADAPIKTRATIGAAYASGVLTMFAVLAGVLLALKAAGVGVGWGFQLQSPEFVAVMAAVVTLVALNLSGVFEVGTSLTRVGGGSGDGVLGAYGTGVLATIVATPCTAPFMAVAIGAALGASPTMALAVFAALGAGLAAPFVVLSLLPGLTKILPKPGAWMVRLKQALAFPLYATAAWLIWVLAQLTGPGPLLAALLALVLVATAAWVFGLSQGVTGARRKVALGLAVAIFAGALAVGRPVADAAPPQTVAVAGPAPVVPFTPAALAALEAEGRPVFLNATAAWCITCKVNEEAVFADEAFAALLADNDVTFMVADWTRRDNDVSALMDRFGRAGVPLYVFFSGRGEATVLPQILTFARLKNTFAGASRSLALTKAPQ
ncbi:MAG: protein-disulfide reductase DsbD domain-containing protein [Pseudomonadota bacterium]